jgi:hypothetical protein
MGQVGRFILVGVSVFGFHRGRKGRDASSVGWRTQYYMPGAEIECV